MSDTMPPERHFWSIMRTTLLWLGVFFTSHADHTTDWFGWFNWMAFLGAASLASYTFSAYRMSYRSRRIVVDLTKLRRDGHAE